MTSKSSSLTDRTTTPSPTKSTTVSKTVGICPGSNLEPQKYDAMSLPGRPWVDVTAAPIVNAIKNHLLGLDLVTTCYSLKNTPNAPRNETAPLVPFYLVRCAPQKSAYVSETGNISGKRVDVSYEIPRVPQDSTYSHS